MTDTVAMSNTDPRAGAFTGDSEVGIVDWGLNCVTKSSVSRAETRTDPASSPIRFAWNLWVRVPVVSNCARLAPAMT